MKKETTPKLSFTVGSVLGATEAFARIGIFETTSYKLLERQYKADKDPEILLMIRKGINTVSERIYNLTDLEHPTTKKAAQRHFYHVPAEEWWENLSLAWNPQEDPGGIDVLRQAKVQDVQALARPYNGEITEEQQADITRLGTALDAAQELVISYMEYQLLRVGQRKLSSGRYAPESELKRRAAKFL